MTTLSQAQLDRIVEITNTRGAAFGYPVSGVPGLTPYPYTFVSAEIIANNHLQITANMTVHNKDIDEKKHARFPLPEPPSAELDALVNEILDLVERTAMLKFGR